MILEDRTLSEGSVGLGEGYGGREGRESKGRILRNAIFCGFRYFAYGR